MNYTFNDITNFIISVIKKHKIVQSSNVGTIDEINFNDEDASPEYPFCFLQPQSGVMNEGESQYTYNLLVMDLVPIESNNHESIQSDMLNIGQDILFYIILNHRDEYTITTPITFTYFTEQFNNKVSGVNIQFTISSQIDISCLDLPFN